MNVHDQIKLLKSSNSYYEFVVNATMQGLNKASYHKILTNALNGYYKKKTKILTVYNRAMHKKAYAMMKEATFNGKMSMHTFLKNIEFYLISLR